MNIDFAFAFCIENNSLLVEEPIKKENSKYKKHLISSIRKIQKKIHINKRGEINLSKNNKKKKIFLIKYDKKNILGIISDDLENKNMVYNFLDDFYLEYRKEKIINKNSKIFVWLKKEFKELETGNRKSVFDHKRSFRRGSRSKSINLKKKKIDPEKKNEKEKKFLQKLKNKNDFDLGDIIERESQENTDSKLSSNLTSDFRLSELSNNNEVLKKNKLGTIVESIKDYENETGLKLKEKEGIIIEVDDEEESDNVIKDSENPFHDRDENNIRLNRENERNIIRERNSSLDSSKTLKKNKKDNFKLVNFNDIEIKSLEDLEEDDSFNNKNDETNIESSNNEGLNKNLLEEQGEGGFNGFWNKYKFPFLIWMLVLFSIIIIILIMSK